MRQDTMSAKARGRAVVDAHASVQDAAAKAAAKAANDIPAPVPVPAPAPEPGK